jgi:hypothetical protein
MVGPQSLTGSTERFVGEAFTLRFIPAREDMATPASWGNPISTRAAIEEMPEGVIVVADAMGVRDAGIFGDILAVRMAKRGVLGLVTDGTMRDRVGVLASGLPIWCAGIAAPSSVNGLTFVGWQEPIGCGGVAVFPHDVIVADGDPGGMGCVRGTGAGTVRSLGGQRGRERHETARSLSAERGKQGEVRGVAGKDIAAPAKRDVLRSVQSSQLPHPPESRPIR